MFKLMRMYISIIFKSGKYKGHLVWQFISLMYISLYVWRYWMGTGLEGVEFYKRLSLYIALAFLIPLIRVGMDFVFNAWKLGFDDIDLIGITDLEGVLETSLPVGRKKMLNTRIIFSLLYGLILCILGFLPFLQHSIMTTNIMIKILFVYCISLLGGVIFSVINYIWKGIGCWFITFLFQIVFSLGSLALMYFGKLDNGLWLIYLAAILVLTVLVYLAAIKRINSIDLLHEYQPSSPTKGRLKKVSAMKLLVGESVIVGKILIGVAIALSLTMLVTGFRYIFVIIPFAMLLFMMSVKEGGDVFGPELILVKSLPMNKRKIVLKIMANMLMLIVILEIINIVGAASLDYFGKFIDVNVERFAILLITVKLPLAISSIFTLLPSTIANEVRGVSVEMILISLFIGWLSIQLTYWIASVNLGMILTISALSYTLAIFIVKKAYERISVFLEGPLEL